MNPQEIAFALQGLTIYFAAAASAPTPVQCKVDQQYTGNATATNSQYTVTNYATAGIILAWGATAAAATANAVNPKAGTPTYSFAMLPLSKETISAPLNSFFTAILQSGSTAGDVYVSPGGGM